MTDSAESSAGTSSAHGEVNASCATDAMLRRPLKAVMLDRLMDASAWLDREALAQGASQCSMAIDDALADLVIEGQAEYRQGVGYRLAGSALARAALRQLRRDQVARAVCSRQVGDQYRVGVAERREGSDALGCVMYEFTLPLPEPGPRAIDRHLAQVQALIDHTLGERNG